MSEEIQRFIEKGTSLLQDSKYEEALQCFESALVLDPKNTSLWNKKGIALRSLGRYDEAIECFNRSLEIEPTDLDAS